MFNQSGPAATLEQAVKLQILAEKCSKRSFLAT
jgi:hypothetical protein